MHIITTLAIIVNIISIIVLSIGLFYNFEQPKIKAVYGYIIAGSMITYIAALFLVLIHGFIIKHYSYSIILFLCMISPFVIGKFVKYETLKKYTIIQIMCFIVSLATILLNV